jgi:hypothetical protein
MPHPILADWVDLLAFLLAMMACLYASKKADLFASVRWQALASFLLLLALNKFFFIDFCVTQLFSGMASQFDLYQHRRGAQAVLVLLMLSIVGVIMYYTQRKLHSQLVWLKWAYICAYGLVTLVMLRLISLHQLDRLLYSDVIGLGLGLNWMIEIGFNGMIVMCTIMFANKCKTHP